MPTRTMSFCEESGLGCKPALCSSVGRLNSLHEIVAIPVALCSMPYTLAHRGSLVGQRMGKFLYRINSIRNDCILVQLMRFYNGELCFYIASEHNAWKYSMLFI